MLFSTAHAENLFTTVTSGSSISDYFRQQFEHVTPVNVLIALIMGLLAGMIVAFTYRRCYRGVLYSPSFAITLIMLTLITTPVVMCIKSDISLSMGMVGALSIVRFRTAIKEPMDTAYMFWALTMGILLGAGMQLVALVVALGIAAIIFLLTWVRVRSNDSYLLVVHYDQAAESDIMREVADKVSNRRLRSKTVSRGGSEMTIEVRLKNRQDLVATLLGIEGVYDATLVSCQSEAGA